MKPIEDYAILLLDENGIILDWNKGFEKNKGYKANEIIGKNFRVFYTAPDRENKLPEQLIAKAIANGSAGHEGFLMRKDGTTFWGSTLISALFDKNEQLTGFLKISHDLSDKKELEEKLKKLNEELEQQVKERTTELQQQFKEISDYKFAIDESSIVSFTDPIGNIKYANNKFCKISGYSLEELIGQNHRLVNSGLHSQEFFSDLWKTISNGKVWKGEMRNRAKNGTIYWVDATIIPFLDEDHKPYQYVAIRNDITERKKAEAELMKVNRLYTFISAINQSIVHLKDEDVLLSAACRIAIEIGKFKLAWIGMFNHLEKTISTVNGSGMPAEELDRILRMHMQVNGPQEYVMKVGKYYLSNHIEQDAALETWRPLAAKHGVQSCMILPLKRGNKTIGSFNVYAAELNFFGKEEITLLEEVAGDISFALENFETAALHREGEEKLTQSEAKLREAQVIGHMGNWEIDMITNTHFWSDEFYNIYGVKKEEAVPSEELFLSFIHPDDKEFVRKMMELAFKTLTDSFFDFRFIRHDGTVRYGYSSYRFEFDKNKKPIRLYGIVQDVTEKKNAELNLNKLVKELTVKNNELYKTNIELDKFVYSTSHDLRAPLMSVLGLVAICRDHLQQPEEIKNLLSMMDTSVNRVDETIKSILTYSRNSRMEIKPELLNIEKITEEVIDDLKHFNHGHKIQFNLTTGREFSFFSDKIRVKSLITNLVSNAVKYQRSDEPHPAVNINLNFANDELTLIVEDNGEGIPKKFHSKIFEMFTRSSQESTGSGLGLYICKEIVNKLGGSIRVASQPGTGSAFKVKLPNLNAQKTTS